MDAARPCAQNTYGGTRPIYVGFHLDRLEHRRRFARRAGKPPPLRNCPILGPNSHSADHPPPPSPPLERRNVRAKAIQIRNLYLRQPRAPPTLRRFTTQVLGRQ